MAIEVHVVDLFCTIANPHLEFNTSESFCDFLAFKVREKGTQNTLNTHEVMYTCTHIKCISHVNQIHSPQTLNADKNYRMYTACVQVKYIFSCQ